MDSGLDKPVVSLIIPVYNVAQYLNLALHSAVSQTLENIEIIVVNDGSTDSSSKIIKKFENKYSNIIVINQENSGLSAARNAGLKIAKGEYIAFMDSDDHIAPDFLETLYNAATISGADITYCNYKVYYPKKGVAIPLPLTAQNSILPQKPALKKIIMDVTMHYFAWNKLYKRSLFIDNEIEFYDMYFEDIATTPRLFYFASKVAILNCSPYYYTQRDGSILKSMSVKKINDYNLAFGIIRNFLENQGNYEEYSLAFKIYGLRNYFVNIYNVFQVHLCKYNFKGFIKNLKMSFKALNYFMSNNYTACEQIPKLPFVVIDPEEFKKSTVTGE